MGRTWQSAPFYGIYVEMPNFRFGTKPGRAPIVSHLLLQPGEGYEDAVGVSPLAWRAVRRSPSLACIDGRSAGAWKQRSLKSPRNSAMAETPALTPFDIKYC